MKTCPDKSPTSAMVVSVWSGHVAAAASEKEREARMRIEHGEAERGAGGRSALAGVERPTGGSAAPDRSRSGTPRQPVAVARLGGRKLHAGPDEGGAVGPPEQKRHPRDEERRAADVNVDHRLVGVPVVRHLRPAEEDRRERRGHQPVRGPLRPRESQHPFCRHSRSMREGT